MRITKKQLIHWLELCNTTYDKNQEHLTELDRDIGDADHGLNMNRGFKKVNDTLPKLKEQDISAIFKNTGMTLLSSVGGASGPLYGTLFIRTAQSMGADEDISLAELINALKSGVNGVISRGKAELGDKTMCDVWLPVINQAQISLQQGMAEEYVLNEMLEMADHATLSTIEMQAKKGRASYLGERSIGHQDPGATSSQLMINALIEAIKG